MLATRAPRICARCHGLIRSANADAKTSASAGAGLHRHARSLSTFPPATRGPVDAGVLGARQASGTAPNSSIPQQQDDRPAHGRRSDPTGRGADDGFASTLKSLLAYPYVASLARGPGLQIPAGANKKAGIPSSSAARGSSRTSSRPSPGDVTDGDTALAHPYIAQLSHTPPLSLSPSKARREAQARPGAVGHSLRAEKGAAIGRDAVGTNARHGVDRDAASGFGVPRQQRGSTAPAPSAARGESAQHQQQQHPQPSPQKGGLAQSCPSPQAPYAEGEGRTDAGVIGGDGGVTGEAIVGSSPPQPGSATPADKRKRRVCVCVCVCGGGGGGVCV